MGAGQGREGPGWVRPSLCLVTEPTQAPGPSRPCPALISCIPGIFIKNNLHSRIFPGHSSSLMTLGLAYITIGPPLN